jgi:outer membrane murein-binding lipoprotein Lpp
MNERQSQPARIDALLSQDRAVSSFNFEEFRVKLEASIRQLEERARTIRQAQLCGLGVFLFCVVSVFLMQVSGIELPRWMRLVLGASGVTAILTTGVLAAIYQYRYAPAVTRAKSDLTSTMIAELQQQVADLSRKVDGK